MSKNKLKIAILFGGRSAEHEVSINSSKNVIDAINKNKYEVISIKINYDGSFDLNKLISCDVCFPVLHGPYGEDGSIQGLLKSLNIPFVGPSVLGSALSMDKDITKRLLRDAKIKIGKYLVFKKGEKIKFEKIKKELGLPVFVKPANLGSSVGINKVEKESEFKKAIDEAFLYDTKIVIEKNIIGREIECAILGNENPKASKLGEIAPTKDFYSYDAKYINDSAKLVVGVKLPKNIEKKIQSIAVQVFKTLECEGLSRVDFFLTKKGEIYVNEINTIPGFTNISMYPKLWEISGINREDLVDTLIILAMARFDRENKLKTRKE